MVNRRTIRTGRGRDPTVERVEKDFRFERLGEVIIHARLETALAVALHGVRGHGNDWNAQAGLRLARADKTRRFEAVHAGHLRIHQHRVVGIVAGFLKRLPARFHRVHRKTCFLEKNDRQFLVDQIVFGNQDSLAEFSLLFEDVARDKPGALILFLIEGRQHGVEEHLLFDGFEQIARASQLFEAGCVAALAHRGEDDDLDFLQRGIALDGASRVGRVARPPRAAHPGPRNWHGTINLSPC